MRSLSAQTSGFTAHSNSTDEAVLASYSFPANTLLVGQRIAFSASLEATSTNSTDTLTVKMRLGGTTLTGTVIWTSAAIDVANGDSCRVTGELFVTAIGSSSGSITAACLGAGPDATGTAAGSSDVNVVGSLNTEAALLLELTADWSVQSASNSCIARNFHVDLLNAA